MRVRDEPNYMENAPESVKQQAAAIAPSNDEEGVAWALQKYVLKYVNH